MDFVSEERRNGPSQIATQRRSGSKIVNCLIFLQFDGYLLMSQLFGLFFEGRTESAVPGNGQTSFAT